MKKKIFAVALAAVMAISSAVCAFGATADVSIDAGFSANTGEEVLSGDFDVTYTFKNTSKDASSNWFNFILEMHTKDNVGYNADAGADAPVYIDMRSDNFGWVANSKEATAPAIEWAPLPEGQTWDTYGADMAAGVDCTVNVVRKGNTFTVKMTEGNYKFEGTVTVPDFEGQDVVIWLTGEKVDLTNVKFTNNTATAPAEDPTEAPANNEQATTAAPAASANTGDATTVAGVAVVALAAAAAVVVLKKRTVTE